MRTKYTIAEAPSMPRSAFSAFFCALSAFTLTACNTTPAVQPEARANAASFKGVVHGGQQAVTAATIQLYAVNTTTTGGASTKLLTPTVTTSDGTGVNNANANANNNFNALPAGQFLINNADFTCPATTTTPVYLTASTGNPGNPGGTVNLNLQLLVALGPCSGVTGIASVNVNEVTTVGAIAALYPYTTAYNAIGSTAANASALTTAFNTTANEYSNYATGLAPGPALPNGYSADTPDVNALANVIATCVNSIGGVSGDGSNCGNLFALSKNTAGTVAPTDTVAALLNIRLNPTRSVTTIFNLQNAAAPFAPTNPAAPADYTLPITTVLTSAPTFSVPAGAYTSAQSVSISDADTNAQIRYTIDGTAPGASSSLYSSAVSIGQTTNLQAIAIDSSARSAVTSATYTLSNITATIGLAPVSVPAGSTAAVPVTATGNSNGSVVTFSTANGVDGSFSPTTCTIASGTCTVNYVPTGALTKLSYPAGLVASFSAAGSYNAATASSTLTLIPTFTTKDITDFTGTTGAAPGEYSIYESLIQARDGNFYGTSHSGGINGGSSQGAGTVFKVTPAGVYTLLHSFTYNVPTDGYFPIGNLIQANDGNLYGVTLSGGPGVTGQQNYSGGVLFKITLPAGTYSIIHNFGSSVTDPNTPEAGVIQGTDGNLYGTTNLGGDPYALAGAVYKISLAGTNFTNIHSFLGGTDGKSSYSGLVQGADGLFYGNTNAGGSSSLGTIFSVSSTGTTYNILHTFTGTTTDGKNPYASSLIQGADGYFYGTTSFGGANVCSGTTIYCGVLYKIAAAGGNTFSLVHSFSIPEGVLPYGALTLGSDGNFYGTNRLGGTNNIGTIYSITPFGTLTVIHQATTATTDGNTFYGGLIQGSDGDFYAQSYQGGAGNFGAILKVIPSPAFPAPVTLTVPATVTHGASFTLGYTVSNAYSTTLQTCNAIKTTTQNATLTAPAAAGTYTYGLSCGGQQSSSISLVVQ